MAITIQPLVFQQRQGDLVAEVYVIPLVAREHQDKDTLVAQAQLQPITPVQVVVVQGLLEAQAVEQPPETAVLA